jgi:hypothetical protein
MTTQESSADANANARFATFPIVLATSSITPFDGAW